MGEYPMLADERMVCNIWVEGLPQQQGSKTAFALPVQAGQIRSKVVMTEANKNLKVWRELVYGYACEYMSQEEEELVTGPVKVAVRFEFRRLKAHYKSDGETLRNDRPHFKQSMPDLDKLQRAIGDALTGVVFKDDAQIAVWHAVKVFGSTPGAHIRVYAL